MSLEQQISELKDAIVSLTAAIKAQSTTTVTSAPVAATPAAPAPVAGPYPPTPDVPAPVVAPAPAPVMPPPPTFAPSPAVVASSAAPFTDGKGLITYVMEAYKKMGPVKGAEIQGVLTKMGVSNVNDVQPTQYGAFYTAVEALK